MCEGFTRSMQPACTLQGEDAASFAHEAGYDAYMTASAFAGLLRLLELRQDPQSGAAGFQAQQSAIEPRLRPLSLEAAAPHAWRVNVSRRVHGVPFSEVPLLHCGSLFSATRSGVS